MTITANELIELASSPESSFQQMKEVVEHLSLNELKELVNSLERDFHPPRLHQNRVMFAWEIVNQVRTHRLLQHWCDLVVDYETAL